MLCAITFWPIYLETGMVTKSSSGHNANTIAKPCVSCRTAASPLSGRGMMTVKVTLGAKRMRLTSLVFKTVEVALHRF